MHSPNPEHRLLIGIGNSARGDDALGWLFAERAAAAYPQGLDVVFRYQLQVEDAELIRPYDEVFFADASRETLENGCSLRECQPGGGPAFSSHSQSPEAILALCQDLYGMAPSAWVVAMQGEQWELGQEPGADALVHLEKAWALWCEHLAMVRGAAQYTATSKSSRDA